MVMENGAATRVSVWFVGSTKLSSSATLSYSNLEFGNGDAILFLGHNPPEVLTSIQRLEDELRALKHRINSQ